MKWVKGSVCAAFLAAACCTAQTPLKVIRDVRNGPVRQRVAVGTAEPARLEKEALALLGSREVTLGRLVIYGSPSEAMVVERTSRLDESGWREAQAQMRPNGVIVEPGRCPEVSEAIKIGANILFRAVDARCKATGRLIQGTSNPLLVSAQGARHEILALSMRVVYDGLPFIDVFARTKSEPTEQLAAEILARIKAVAGAGHLLTVVRNDTCFYGSCGFPAPFLFDGSAPLEFSRCQSPLSVSATCGTIGGHSVNCSHYEGKQ